MEDDPVLLTYSNSCSLLTGVRGLVYKTPWSEGGGGLQYVAVQRLFLKVTANPVNEQKKRY